MAKDESQSSSLSLSLSLDMISGVAMDFSTFTFVLDEIARNIVDSALARGYTQVGTVTLHQIQNQDQDQDKKKEVCVSKLYAKSSTVCLVHQCGVLPDSLYSAWTQLFLTHPTCQSCLVLSGLPIAAYNSNIDLGGLRILYSSAVEETEKEKFHHCIPLDTGNILSGCAAAVVCQCEYTSLKAVVCVSLRGLSYTHEAAMMFEQISPQVSEYLQVEGLQLSGNNALHRKMIKSDQFLSRTENMYL